MRAGLKRTNKARTQAKLMVLTVKAVIKPQLPQNQSRMLTRTKEIKITLPPNSTLLNKRIEMMEVLIHQMTKTTISTQTQKNQVRILTHK